MPIYQAIILGIVQGLTEFFPVSSSGHLILVPWLFNWTFLLANPSFNKTFDVALHVGTFIGAAIYFREDIARYIGAWYRSVRTRSVSTPDERISWLLILATIPGVLAGALGEEVIDKHLGQPWLIAMWLIVFGVVLFLVDHRARRDRDVDELTTRDALWLGLAQALALSPGVSRSGVTITAARALRMTREAAVRFSFLMSLPIIGGAGAYKGLKLLGSGIPNGTGPAFAAGMAASAITGFAAVSLTLRLVRKRPMDTFVAYRIVAALAVLGIIATGFRPAG